MIKLPNPKITENLDDLEGLEDASLDLKPLQNMIVISIAVFMSFFHIYTLGFSPVTPWILFTVHLSLGSILILMVYPINKSKKNSISIVDLILISLILYSCGYLIIEMNELIHRIGIAPTNLDLFVALIMVGIVLEITRRTCGILLPLIAVVFIVYARFGEYVPGILGHRGYSWERIISYLNGMDAIFSVPIAASANFVFLFIVFSAFIQVSGAGKFFIDFATSLTGKSRGGPAKTSVIASALFGTVTGNSVANVVSSGAFTIPLMKKTGYSARFSGAVESVASTGGQIMPPIMGSAAFIMAILIGVPYQTIMIAAIIPALLYFISILVMVDLEAAKNGLKGMPKEMLPKMKDVLKNVHLIIPLLVLIIVLVVLGASPIKAAIWGMGTSIVMAAFKKETRMGPKKIIEALSTGALNALGMIAACATAGIIIGVLNLTGSGLKFASVIIGFAGDFLPLALFLTMCASIILGMGLPTTAAYLITAAVVAPALIGMGVPALSAHMFVFYFACMSAITPPIALAAYAGAGIAKAKPIEVALTAVKLGLIAYIIPFMFVYGPALLGEGTPSEIILATITALIGTFALGFSIQGWFWKQRANLLLRVILFAAAIILIIPGILTDFIGIVLILVSYGLQVTVFKENFIVEENKVNINES